MPLCKVTLSWIKNVHITQAVILTKFETEIRTWIDPDFWTDSLKGSAVVAKSPLKDQKAIFARFLQS